MEPWIHNEVPSALRLQGHLGMGDFPPVAQGGRTKCFNSLSPGWESPCISLLLHELIIPGTGRDTTEIKPYPERLA